MKSSNTHFDVIIIGAGASGLMCAIEAGKRGRQVLVIDHENKAGKKILISGGGRCNFTNLTVDTGNYLSHNPYFAKYALNQFNQHDFIALIKKHNISFHERDHGRLFCDNSAKDIVSMLMNECDNAGVQFQFETKVKEVSKEDNSSFKIVTTKGVFSSVSLVVATGGLSIPSIGASPFGYDIAKQFGLRVWETSAGLVSLTLEPKLLSKISALSGIAIESSVRIGKQVFRENLLFTHKGLSGPAILQVSSYWKPKEKIIINLLPDINVFERLVNFQNKYGQRKLKSILSLLIAKRIVAIFFEDLDLDKPIAETSQKIFRKIAHQLQSWEITPTGTGGYASAEVTTGGVDCKAISAKTMEARNIPNLYFIGEVLDVTGQLGGYNFQWAWSSGWVAGQNV